ncbi:MAG: alginate lyase family protein [Terriglobia bacterium]
MMPIPKTWRKAAERLAAMSQEEIRSRLRQEIRKRTDAVVFGVGAGALVRWFYGVDSGQNPKPRSPAPAHATLPPPGRFFFEPKQIALIVKLLRERLPHEAETIIEQSERILRHEFDLLGYENLNYGPVIDWSEDAANHRRAPRRLWYNVHYLDFNEVGDHKVIWELNRHQHLVTLAKALHLTGDSRFVDELLTQWRQWHRANPYPKGINWASSLEVAFRSLSWLWLGHLLAPSPAAPQSFQGELLRSLALSGRHIERYLSTYTSPNTHLLGEAVALFSIGTLCPRLRFAARWRALGWHIILEQADKQVQADGMHFEQSLYYHVYALDFFLHAHQLALRNEIAIPAAFDRVLEKMLDVLRRLSQAGVPAGFGDDDGGRVFDPRRNRREHLTDPLSTGAVIFERGDFKAASGGLKEETLWLLGAKGVRLFDALPAAARPPASLSLKTSGFFSMFGETAEKAGSGSGAGERNCRQQLVIDAGPQGAGNSGHGHADALSVQLSVAGHAGGEEWLIDPGTFRYMGGSQERELFRGTAAHNTLQVDGLSQADPVAPFAWKLLPRVRPELWITSERFDLFVGSHDGYQRLPEPVLHRRWVFYLKPYFWLVRDVAEGAGEHQLEIFWHFPPHFTPSYTPPGFTLKTGTEPSIGARGLVIIPAEKHGWSQEVRRGYTSPAYGIEIPAPVVRFSTTTRLPRDLAVILKPVCGAPERVGHLSRINIGGDAATAGLCYEDAGARHLFLFGSGGQAWKLGGWASDARFVYVGRKKGTLSLALCAGSWFEAEGRRILTCDRVTERCEMVISGRKQTFFCTDPAAVVDGDFATMRRIDE